MSFQLNADDLLARIRHDWPAEYRQSSLALQVEILTADLATERAEKERLADLLEQAQEQAQLPARSAGSATPFPGSYPLVGEGADRA